MLEDVLINICYVRLYLKATHACAPHLAGDCPITSVVFPEQRYLTVPLICAALTQMFGVTLQLLPEIAIQVAWPCSAPSAGWAPAPPPGLGQEGKPKGSCFPLAQIQHSAAQGPSQSHTSSTSPWRWQPLAWHHPGLCHQAPAAGTLG